MPLSNNRATQRSVKRFHQGFNGNVTAELFIVDAQKLRFQANITVQTGDVNTPTVTYTPCDDNGKVRTFGSVDDVFKFVNGAYNDVISFEATFVDVLSINNPFVPPTDAVADATKKKAAFIKLRDGMGDNILALTAKRDSEIASGWNLGTAHPALQANHAETLKQLDTATATRQYFIDRIAAMDLIINPV